MPPTQSGRVGHVVIREAIPGVGYLVDCDCGRKRVRKTSRQIAQAKHSGAALTCSRYCPLKRKANTGREPGGRRTG